MVIGSLKPLVAGSSPARVTLLVKVGARMAENTLVSWACAPEWVTLAEATALSGHDEATLRWLISDGSVEGQEEDGLWTVKTADLRAFQKALLDVKWLSETEEHAV